MEEYTGSLKEVSLGAETAGQMYERLLVIVSDEDGRYVAERLGVRSINVGEKLGEELLEVPAKRRPLKVAELLGDLLSSTGDGGILLDHIEILFDKSLRLDPLHLLRSVSRQRLVIVMWRGEVDAGKLVYGFPGHSEHRSYPVRELTLVQLPRTSAGA